MKLENAVEAMQWEADWALVSEAVGVPFAVPPRLSPEPFAQFESQDALATAEGWKPWVPDDPYTPEDESEAYPKGVMYFQRRDYWSGSFSYDEVWGDGNGSMSKEIVYRHPQKYDLRVGVNGGLVDRKGREQTSVLTGSQTERSYYTHIVDGVEVRDGLASIETIEITGRLPYSQSAAHQAWEDVTEGKSFGKLKNALSEAYGNGPEALQEWKDANPYWAFLANDLDPAGGDPDFDDEVQSAWRGNGGRSNNDGPLGHGNVARWPGSVHQWAAGARAHWNLVRVWQCDHADWAARREAALAATAEWEVAEAEWQVSKSAHDAAMAAWEAEEAAWQAAKQALEDWRQAMEDFQNGTGEDPGPRPPDPGPRPDKPAPMCPADPPPMPEPWDDEQNPEPEHPGTYDVPRPEDPGDEPWEDENWDKYYQKRTFKSYDSEGALVEDIEETTVVTSFPLSSAAGPSDESYVGDSDSGVEYSDPLAATEWQTLVEAAMREKTPVPEDYAWAPIWDPGGEVDDSGDLTREYSYLKMPGDPTPGEPPDPIDPENPPNWDDLDGDGLPDYEPYEMRGRVVRYRFGVPCFYSSAEHPRITYEVGWTVADAADSWWIWYFSPVDLEHAIWEKVHDRWLVRKALWENLDYTAEVEAWQWRKDRHEESQAAIQAAHDIWEAGRAAWEAENPPGWVYPVPEPPAPTEFSEPNPALSYFPAVSFEDHSGEAEPEEPAADEPKPAAVGFVALGDVETWAWIGRDDGVVAEGDPPEERGTMTDRWSEWYHLTLPERGRRKYVANVGVTGWKSARIGNLRTVAIPSFYFGGQLDITVGQWPEGARTLERQWLLVSAEWQDPGGGV